MVDKAKTDGLMRDLSLLLPKMKENLEAGGYVFDYPDRVIVPPTNMSAMLIKRMRAEFGSFPYAVESFYKFIGEVDFTGSTEAFEEFEYPDPLQLGPFDYYGDCLDKFLSSDQEKEYWNEGWGGFALLVSADYYHKENISGGPEYFICLPASNDDPQLEATPELNTFLEYLALGLRHAGFPGYCAVGGVLPPYYSDESLVREAEALSRRFSELASEYKNDRSTATS
jgi:hypothetical protein